MRGGTWHPAAPWVGWHVTDRDGVTATADSSADATWVVGIGWSAGGVEALSDCSGWFESVIAARNLPLSFVTPAFTVLLEVLPDSVPRARAMARQGQAACTQPIG
jgi:hypothetical protein